MRIVHISSELTPYSKTGGLADVVAALARKLTQFGHEVIVITPFYYLIQKQHLIVENVGEKEIKIGRRKFFCQFKRAKTADGYDVYFIDQKRLFGQTKKIYSYAGCGQTINDALRFYLFDLAALELLELIDYKPDIIHCHDWQSGLVPNFLKYKYKKRPFFRKVKTLFTIHNLNYQGAFDWWQIPKKKIDNGKGLPPTQLKKIRWINFAKRAIFCADAISTVSERYAQEILTKEFGCGLEKYLQKRKKDVFGIINGIDYSVHNPQFDKHIYFNYDWNSLDKKLKNKIKLQEELGLKVDGEIPLIGMANRLTEQKGFDLIIKILPTLLRLNLQIVMVGEGKKVYEEYFKKMAKKHPKSIAYIYPFSSAWESKIDAASDMFLLPSRFEPCGISQLKSLRYGSVPIVRKTGGLSDTITDYNPKTGKGTGFVFTAWSEYDLLAAIVRALATYKRRKEWVHLTWQAMKEVFSWELPAKKYLSLYRRILRKK